MKNSFSKIVLTDGIVAGILGVGLSAAFYFGARPLFYGSYAHTLSWTTLMGFLMFRAGLKLEHFSDGNPMRVMGGVLGVFAIALAMAHGFEFVLYNFMDKNANIEQQKMMLEAYKKLAALDKHTNLEAQFAGVNFHDIPSTIWSMGKGILGGGVISLILTAVLSRVR